MNIPDMIVRLERHKTMSQFATQADLYQDLNKDREEAAKLLKEITGLLGRCTVYGLSRKLTDAICDKLGV